jgi:hypothetical protein
MRSVQTLYLTFCFIGLSLLPASAQAIDLDWSGSFVSDTNWIYNYQMGLGRGTQGQFSYTRGTPTDSNGDTKITGADHEDGYTVLEGGDRNAFFQSLFLKLRPVAVVNDTIYIKSELWLGDPVVGFFGGSAPHRFDQRQYYSNYSRGSTVTAQRYWAEFLSDVGTIQLGKAPLHWGLGLVWNSGEDLFSRYHSTGDMVRLVSKFGSFSFAPAVIKYSMGNSVGGSCPNPLSGSPCTPAQGGGGVTDYSIMFRYLNLDEDMELGVNFVRRLSGAAPDTTGGFLGVNGNPSGGNFNTWDIYGKKDFGDLYLAAEIPIATGDIGGVDYDTFAMAFESGWKHSEWLDTTLKFGLAPGQGNLSRGGSPNTYKAFYFHHNYQIALIMFNYQFRNFSGPSNSNNPGTTSGNVASPFDNPIVNARYVAPTIGFNTGKWRFVSTFAFAEALQTADGNQAFFHYWKRKYVDPPSNSGDRFKGSQSKSLGWEMDYGARFNLDENFTFGMDFGWYFPGKFYKFSNSKNENVPSTVFATNLRVGVTF